MKLLLTTVHLMILLAGCRQVECVEVSETETPIPVAEVIAHGYETQDGSVITYSDVTVGDDKAPEDLDTKDYSDRSTAK